MLYAQANTIPPPISRGRGRVTAMGKATIG
jgi:hypothetical protein